MKITPDLFEAFLKCPTKCWLRSQREPSTGNKYPDWVRTQNEAYRIEGVRRLITNISPDEWVTSPSETENLKTAKWWLAVDLTAHSQDLKSTLHAVERVPSEGKGKAATCIPIRFIFTNKLTRDDKLLVAFDALVLSEMLSREVRLGKIIHGDNYATLKVKTSELASVVRKRTERVAALLSNSTPPDLVLNRHCGECEFQERCRQKAIEKDDLSLLSGMSEKERKELHSKGIFTVIQLSYTFRPRRRPKRLRDKREKYHHALKALAIREKKIHIVGTPELKIDGTPVYLDVESLPDRDFYYLIGLRIESPHSTIQHSLWADKVDDEKTIWCDFLRILTSVETPVLLHYGSFESIFLRAMIERYGEPSAGSIATAAVKSSVNVLSVVYGQVYFPAYSNGLKQTACTLGYAWTDEGVSGTQSIVWRNQWSISHQLSAKERLIRYNVEDCEALSLVTTTLRQIGSQGIHGGGTDHTKAAAVIRADAAPYPRKRQWGTFKSPLANFERINSAAHWNYKIDRVYARSAKVKQPRKNRRRDLKLNQAPETVVIWKVDRSCPHCDHSIGVKRIKRSRTHYDLLIGYHSVKQRIVRYVFQTYECLKCGSTFGLPERFKLSRVYGWNLIAFFLYEVIELSIPQLSVMHSFNRMFGLQLTRNCSHFIKTKGAYYYTETKEQIIKRLVSGKLLHVDETRANVQGKAAFVWVLANRESVAYIFSESREGELIQNLLAEFKGVLVSDFYAAYASIGCPRQNCLIHLMRDLNGEILDNPFDDQLKEIVVGFGDLLKAIIETVDRYGLKTHFLRKHLICVDRFYLKLEESNFQSEAALKCKKRFDRDKNTLFTFLSHDGVPWHNNNAEHAIKAFARLREVIAGSSTKRGIEEYLTLLSVDQTCVYSGVDFIDFVRSGEKDIHAFAETKGRRRRRTPPMSVHSTTGQRKRDGAYSGQNGTAIPM